jgi:hypothetical protein
MHERPAEQLALQSFKGHSPAGLRWTHPVEIVYSDSGGISNVPYSSEGSFNASAANELNEASVLETSAFSMSCACGRLNELNKMIAAKTPFLRSEDLYA